MNQKYFLTPFATIRKLDVDFEVKNLLIPNFKLRFKFFDELSPFRNPDLVGKLFFKRSQIFGFLKESYAMLEELLVSQEDAVGYIETTSACPYHCQICPKSVSKQIRASGELSLTELERILNQLKPNTNVAFHIFGDPLMDSEIYEKITLANYFGIFPSFSTNLITLRNIDLEKFRKIKITNFTVSFDSYDSKLLSVIRGKISQSSIDNAIEKLFKLEQDAQIYKNISKIFLQQIDLNNNQNEVERVKSFVGKGKLFEYLPKKYISFPSVSSSLKTVEKVKGGEFVLLYKILEKSLPFKCLKSWIKNESGVLSDGSFVPCCLTLNKTVELGSSYSKSINDLFLSKEHQEFRKEIFFNNMSESNETCNSCKIHKELAIFENCDIPIDLLAQLKTYCIEDWSQYYEKIKL